MLPNSLLAETIWYPVYFDSPLNIVRAVAFWLTVALAIAFVVCALVLKAERRAKFLKISAFVAIVYACVVGLTLLILTFTSDGITTILFVPLLLLVIALSASAMVLYFKRNLPVYITTGAVVGAALIATLVCMGIHFSSGDSLTDNGIENPDSVNPLALYIFAVLAIAALIFAAFFFGRKDKKGFDTKSVSYAAVCIAMSFALSYLRIVKMPQGGSITIASLLPIMIYSYMFGVKKGVFAGMIYGVLQAFQDPYILHPAQFVLDYPAAFACIGLSGLFANNKKLEKLPQVQIALGGVIAGLCRFLMHFLSGMFAFGEFAPPDTPVWIYSLGYQAGYVLPDIAIAIAAAVFVFSSRNFMKQVRKYKKPEKAAHAEAPASDISATDSQTEV